MEFTVLHERMLLLAKVKYADEEDRKKRITAIIEETSETARKHGQSLFVLAMLYDLQELQKRILAADAQAQN